MNPATLKTMNETDTTTRHWHTGHNTQGYMPEGDIGTHATFEEARFCLAEDLGYAADCTETGGDDHICNDVPCPTYGDDCALTRAENIRALCDELLAETQDETVWQGYACEYSYWICECCEPACMAEIDD